MDISCPIHIIHPELDEVCPISGSYELVSLIGANAKMEILPGAGHSMSQPESLAFWKTSLKQFLQNT